MPRYWLFKSEPECFSFKDLENAPGQTTGWDGVRNYQARNFLRDNVKYGDGVIYYHSNAEPPGIAGIAVVVEEAHPDPTQFDPKEDHFDPKSTPEAPPWVQVGIKAVAEVTPEVPLPALRECKELDGLELLKRGSRLSVHPVSEEHWNVLVRLAGFKHDPHAQWLEKQGLATTAKPSKKPTAKVVKAAVQPAAKSPANPAAKPNPAAKLKKPVKQ